MLWVTRSRVHVDRVACPWLIQRFIDSDAEFLFVPKSQVDKVAAETGATPFDAPGVKLGHRDNKCSFETIIETYALTDAALHRLARIVHAADIAADLHSDEIAPGLEAIGTGFGIILPDDHANLKSQFVVYDALYAWCRLQVASEEGKIR